MNQTNTALCLLASLFLGATTSAQEMPKPSQKLASFDRLIGSFEGSGTVVHSPGKPEQKWTGTTLARKVLGGFFIQEDTTIAFEGGMPTPDGKTIKDPMVFRAFYGWDTENSRYVMISVNNMGAVEHQRITWPDKDTLLVAGATMMGPQRQLYRWMTKFTESGYNVVGHQAMNGGEFHVHVQGAFKKVEKLSATIQVVDAAALMTKTGKEMAQLKPLLGKHNFKGTMVMMPGVPEMPIGGKSHTRMLCGDTVLETTVHGDATEGFPAYEGYGATIWHAGDKCYKGFWVDNMGMFSIDTSWMVDGKYTTTNQRLQMGQPVVQRTILHIKDGELSTAITHSIVGTHEPMKTFEIKYTPAK